MARTAWSSFYPDVLPFVPGCPNIAVEVALRRAAIRLCEESCRHKVALDPFKTEIGIGVYDLVSDTSGEAVVKIIDGNLGGIPIGPLRRDEASKISDWDTRTGPPAGYLLDGLTSVRLYPAPDSVKSVAFTVALRPSDSATGVDSDIASRYRTAIVAGAIASLLKVPKTAWSDFNLSAVYEAEFRTEIRKARAEADKDGTRAPLRTARVAGSIA